MNVRLIRLSKNKADQLGIQVASSPFLIGRDDACQISLASTLVSKRHCSIVLDGDRVMIQDLGSTNGTMVNKTPLEGMRELNDGEVITIGTWAFRVQVRDEVDGGSGTAPIKKSEAVRSERARAVSRERDPSTVPVQSLRDERVDDMVKQAVANAAGPNKSGDNESLNVPIAPPPEMPARLARLLPPRK